jgi:hypothetical protein
MDLKVSARNILRRVYAGKEEGTPSDTEKVEVVKNNPPKTVSFLFFNAGDEIPFKDIASYVKDNKKKALVNLENGNFSWERAILKTNDYNTGEPSSEENSIIYIVSLNRDGTMAGNEVLKDIKNNEKNNNNFKNYEAVLSKLRAMMFVDSKLNFNFSPQMVKRSYADRDLVEVIKAGSISGSLRINDFDNYYGIGTHRMRTMPSTNIPGVSQELVLLGARYEVPSTADNFLGKNKPFLGTKDQMEYLNKIEVTTENEEQPAEKSEGVTPMVEKNEDTNFEPVSEQGKTTKQEVVDTYKSAKDDKDSAIRELKEDDPDANYYTGDNSVMQDLVRRQHKKMKIRKNAQFTSTQPTPSTPATSQSKPGKNPSIPISNNPDENNKSSEVLKNIAEQQKKVNKQVQDLQKTQQTMFGNIKSASDSSVLKVLSLYIES